MKFLGEILNLLNTQMTRPVPYDRFHLFFFALSILAGVLLCKYKKAAGESFVRKFLFVLSATIILLEIYKQINFSFTYKNGQILFDYQWYAFPFQFCSTPMYIGLLAAVIKNERIHQSLCGYLGTYSLFAGLCVMFYPVSVFIGTVGINIQTMICHGSMITVGVYLLYSGHVKLEHKTILKALPVFVATLCIAMVMNEVAHANGLDGFNMFYISRHEPGHLPLYGDVQNMLSCYPLELMIYIVGFTIAAYLMLLIAMGVRALGRVLFRNKATQAV
jgi:hypothetical protein